MKKIFWGAILTVTISSISVLRAENVLISTKTTSLIITAKKGKTPLFQYFGPRVDSDREIFDSGSDFSDPLYPAFGIECWREVAIQVTHNDGNMSLDPVVESIIREQGDEFEITKIVTRDKVYPFYVTICYKAYSDCDVLETWTEIKHTEKKPVALYRFASAFLPVRRGDNWLSYFYGLWGSEASLREEPLGEGMKVIKNKDGIRNTHGTHPSFMITLDGAPAEDSGRVIGGTLAWGGNYRIIFDNDNQHTTRIFAGMNEDQSQYLLDPEEIFVTPIFAFSYSAQGKGGVSRNFHHWARLHRLNHGTELRDILLNSWEGVYYKVNQRTMAQMMSDFADLGGELFVMDDGWYGNKYPRNNGTSGLGDWEVCREKLPGGIEELIATAKRNGLKFGIWIEPEMTNTKSELFEKHPDWVIRQPNRELHPGRGKTQLVLDLSNPEVQEFVFNVVDGLMSRYPEIAYIKWDDNMTMANYGSTYLPKERQSHLNIAYHRGIERILNRIHTKYPNLVMQSCGGGGGRVNYGVMPYYDEFWASDNTDALQRIYIQWGFSTFFPASTIAAHVSADSNHQTGRYLPLKFRFDVAMTGRLGMELQPAKMTDEDRDFARQAIATYKQIRPVVQQGDLYRLISPYGNTGFSSLMYVTPKKERAIFFVFKMRHFRNMPTPAFRMAGLDPQKRYMVCEINARGKTIAMNGKTFSGAFLMQTGLDFSMGSEYASRILELTEVE